ncbi:MAG: hypothetical protein GX842_01940 [Spirochaetales bacterium]|jgi:hypothetical protein|nr:hypothetical protein [Spirochaetales bacterium]
MGDKSGKNYHKALNVCIERLVNEEGENPVDVAKRFFRLGIILSRLGQLGKSIACFNTAFTMRDSEFEVQNSNSQWREFHDFQMASYILGKRSRYIASLAEGDMVHDLIKQRWVKLLDEIENSEIPFRGNDLTPIFRGVKIDFPWAQEDLEELILGERGQVEEEELIECVKITQ